MNPAFLNRQAEFETLAADSVVLALGQDVDLAFLEKTPGMKVVDGVVSVDSHMMTSVPGIFAGGDMVPAERSVTTAVGHGKKAARCVDSFLKGTTYVPPFHRDVVAFSKLNSWYYTHAPQVVQPVIDRGVASPRLRKLCRGLMKRMRWPKRAVAYLAGIALSATSAIRFAPKARSISSESAWVSIFNMRTAPGADCVLPNVHVTRSR